MPENTYLKVNQSLTIPRRELEYRATPSSGPGGQHVNRSSTRIELLWDLQNSPSLTDEAREQLLERLSARLDKDRRLRIVASERRSQLQNRQAAESKLIELVRRALHRPKPRRATKPTKASVERRLDAKRHRAERKRQRDWRE